MRPRSDVLKEHAVVNDTCFLNVVVQNLAASDVDRCAKAAEKGVVLLGFKMYLKMYTKK